MKPTKLHSIRELKGRLEARAIIIENDLAGLERLAEEVESPYYKGHTRGRIETMQLWHNDVCKQLEFVYMLIEEAKNA